MRSSAVIAAAAAILLIAGAAADDTVLLTVVFCPDDFSSKMAIVAVDVTGAYEIRETFDPPEEVFGCALVQEPVVALPRDEGVRCSLQHAL